MTFTGNEKFLVIDPNRSPLGAGKQQDVFQGRLSDLGTYLGNLNSINYDADVIDVTAVNFTNISQTDADVIVNAATPTTTSLNDLTDVDIQTAVPITGDILEYQNGEFVKQALSSRVTQYETATSIINGITVGSSIAQFQNENSTIFDIRESVTSLALDTNGLVYMGENQTYNIDISSAFKVDNIPILT